MSTLKACCNTNDSFSCWVQSLKASPVSPYDTKTVRCIHYLHRSNIPNFPLKSIKGSPLYPIVLRLLTSFDIIPLLLWTQIKVMLNQWACSGVKLRTCMCLHRSIVYICTVNPCASNPCLNNSPCIVVNRDFYCNCSQGFQGTLCAQGACLRRLSNQGACKLIIISGVRERMDYAEHVPIFVTTLTHDKVVHNFKLRSSGS